jgi:microsomal dipeptidase-like Zn-dependent dipeptidase
MFSPFFFADTSKLNYLTSYLLDEGSFTKKDVQKIMGGNAIRLLQQLLPEE